MMCDFRLRPPTFVHMEIDVLEEILYYFDCLRARQRLILIAEYNSHYLRVAHWVLCGLNRLVFGSEGSGFATVLL